MMAKLTWERTLIGGQTKPYDFAASHDCEEPVGRIYRRDGTVNAAPGWFWAMNASGPGIDRSGINCSGTVATKTGRGAPGRHNHRVLAPDLVQPFHKAGGLFLWPENLVLD